MPVPSTPFPAHHVPVRSFDVRARNFRGKLLVACGESSIELDEVGAYIFKSIDGVCTMDQLAAKIAAEYDIPHELALDDGSEFVAELRVLGIVNAKDGPSPMLPGQ